jgi:NAD+ diphosphatase
MPPAPAKTPCRSGPCNRSRPGDPVPPRRPGPAQATRSRPCNKVVKVFEPGFRTNARPGARCLLVRVRGDLVAVEEATVPDQGHFLGDLDGLPCVAVEDTAAVQETTPPVVAGFAELRQLWGKVEEPVWAVAGRAVQIVAWDRSHQFCGRCAQATVLMTEERARRCSKCGLVAHPRLAPAVIVLIERGDGKALLARNARFPDGMYSCIAGFVEPGENLEDTVHREVREEVAIEVCDLRYFGSQPWPFPHSLMIGFFARYASGELVPDGDEIAEAGWFSPSDLPGLPGEMSIARALIEAWRRR